MIDILYENKDYVVCVKPVGVQSQNDNAEDMVKLLKNQLKSEIYPVHRLDTAVGGAMVFAKTKQFAADLSRQVADKKFSKVYLCVVNGEPERDSDVLEDLLFKDSFKNKVFVVKRERRGVKKASLEYTVLEKKEGKSLIRVKLHTGRTHQIRVQFASRKMPLLGDSKYGSRNNECSVALWSYEIGFLYHGQYNSYEILPEFKNFPWGLFNSYKNDII